MGFDMQPTFAGAAFAAAAVAGGAPLFSEGLRVLRLARGFAQLAEARLGEGPSGLVRTRGRVALASPQFGPLSGKPCAGFRLEVAIAGHGPTAVIEERRVFRLTEGGATAQVLGHRGRWNVSVSARREVASKDPLPTGLEALLARSPEARWLRRAGANLVLTERALMAGSECHVVGQMRRGYPLEWPAEIERLKTGTDDVAEVAFAGGTGVDRRLDVEPELWIDDGGHLDFLWISDRPPDPRELAPPWIRAVGLVLGPALSLGGLLYLANAVDFLHSVGRI